MNEDLEVELQHVLVLLKNISIDCKPAMYREAMDSPEREH
jgi:hypothetical protein